MDMLFANSTDPGLDIYFDISTPLDTTLTLLKNVEGLPKDAENVEDVRMELVSQPPLRYWMVTYSHFRSQEHISCKLQDKPLISCCSMCICGEGMLSTECAKQVGLNVIVKAACEVASEGKVAERILTRESALTEAIFESLAVRFTEDESVHIIMTYTKPCQCLDLMPHIMSFLLAKHAQVFQEKKIMLWRGITVEQTNPRGKNALTRMTHDSFLHDEDITMCGRCFRPFFCMQSKVEFM